MMRRTALALAAIVASCTAAVAAAAPKGAAGLSPNQRALQQAIQKTATVTSGHFSFASSTSGGTNGNVATSGSGGFDTKHQTASLSLDLGVLAAALGGASGGVSIPRALDVVVAKNTVYVRLPTVAGQIQRGAQWLRFDSKSLPSSVTRTVNPGALSSVDPQKALAQLTSSVAVHRIATSTVRGSSTTHYRFTVDAAKLVSLLPKSQQSTEAKALKQLNVKTVNVDVYVDGPGYVRRVSTAISKLVLQPASRGVAFKLTFDLYDFGAHVKVTVPPASKTADGGKLLQSLVPGGTGG
jgi:hypothetical protein